jgi:hypothetical protein
LVAGLLGRDYRVNQMTYDLRRLRLAGLIRRIPRSNRYLLTADGIRVAISTPRSTTGSSSPSPRPTILEHQQTYEPHCPQSTDISRIT